MNKDDLKIVKFDFRDCRNEDISDISPLVRYKNDLNDVGFSGLSLRESRLYMTVLAGMYNKQSETQYFAYSDLKRIMGEKSNMSRKDFNKLVEATCEKLRKIGVTMYDTKGNWSMFGIFQRFRGNVEHGLLEVKTDPDFLYMINQLKENFMEIELDEFNSIKSKHTQSLYRKISQYKRCSNKQCYLTLNMAKELFEIKDGVDTKHINNKIIYPAIKEIRNFKSFRYLRLDKEKMKKQRPITTYYFRWDKI